MRIAFKLFLAFWFSGCISASISFAQIKGVGLPFIVNHQRSDYNASTQNWSIAQNSRGFMYFGNNDGILEYDGTSWNMYPVPNSSIVRSLFARGDTIFAGAFETIGFLATDSTGLMSWKSLDHLIPSEFKRFDEVWKIFDFNGKIIFQSFQYIFIYDKQHIKVVKPQSSFSFMHKARNNFYIVDRELGLLQLINDSLSLIGDHAVFFNNDITCILPYSDTQLIIGTSNDGLFLWDGMNLIPWNNETNDQLKQYNMFSGISLNGGNFAFGSISNGIFITDSQGNLLQHINRIKGLQNNTILAIFQDRRNNLWLGLDNGIDYLEISSPLSILNHNFNIESAYASILHNGVLYVGTNQGLFATQRQPSLSTASTLPEFQLIKGTEGQVWSLTVIDNTLFCGHNTGCFVVNGLNARKISDVRGFWSFAASASVNLIMAGTYTGLVRLMKRDSQWYFLDQIDGFKESSRNIVFDNSGHIWVSHGYKGLYRLTLNQDLSQIEDILFLYGEAGLPSSLPYNIQTISDQIIVTTQAGIFKFNVTEEKFIQDKAMNTLFSGKGFIEKIHQDAGGNLWYFTDSYLGVMRLLEDGTFRDITTPFSRINNFLLPAFQNIFTADAHNIFIGSQNGLIHYNPAIINDYTPIDNVYLKEIHFYNNNQQHSLFYPTSNESEIAQLPFALNSVSFRFTSTVFENPDALRFSYRLAGFDDQWSDWVTPNFKEYTNLPDGKYVFEIKALNAFGLESPITAYDFVIRPPFYRTTFAWLVYALFLAVAIAANIFYVRKRMIKIREKEKFRHEKLLAKREKMFKEKSELSEKEIIQLRNEKLVSEMNYKNKELANATLHLIQKTKTLTSLKNDLGKLLKNIPSERPEKYNVNNLLKKVNRDLKNEKNWELFNNYFDEVHQDFIARLKETYTDLSPKELRLCAYLRMNLSTKEIAPLMNISIRGVEISRYRLRKKLRIDHDINLTDYLISY